MFLDAREIHYLDKRQCKSLIDNTKNLKHKLITLFMLDAGLRVSEVISLRISNFDFKKRLLQVSSLKKRDKKKVRVIPLSNRLYDTLAVYIVESKIKGDSFIFPSAATDKHITRFAVNKFLLRKNKSINIDNLHPHALRHTFATQHIANGTPLENIKELLGHEKFDTTLIYSHIPEELLRNNIAKVESVDLTIFDRIKEILFPKINKLINISSPINMQLVGRTDVFNSITDLVSRNINTIIIGGIGTGKTSILENLKFDKKILKFDDTDNIKKSLIFMLLYLFKNDKEHIAKLMFGDFDLDKIKVLLNRESIKNLCDEIKKLVSPGEYILLIDNVDRITPKAIKTLEELKDTFTIVTSAREVPINKSSFLWNFERIELKNLERRYALDLIQKLSYNLEVENYELFRNHIYEQSDGNPRVIFELIERFRKEPVISNDVVKNIQHFGSLQEIDMTFMIFVSLALVAIYRYLSVEIGSDSYRFIGGVAMILLIVFRYFFKNTKRKFV